MRGRVTFYDVERGVGSIAPADGSDAVPVYIGAIERSGLLVLLEGQEVEFTKDAGFDGNPHRAVDIVIR